MRLLFRSWSAITVANRLQQPYTKLGIHQIFDSYRNLQGNADTERGIRTSKEDLVWTKEFDSVADFEAALKQWQRAYNEDYPHSSLGYMTPYEYERWFNASAA